MSIPLVLIPGLLCDETVWAAQVSAFRNHEPVVADHEELDSLPDMAQAVLRRAPPAFAVAAHSMGGRVALEMMRIAPHRILRLALLDTGYEPLASGPSGDREKMSRLALLEIARTRGMHAMGVEWARGMVHPERLTEQRFMDGIYDMIARKSAAQFAAQIRALLSRPDATDVLTSIHCPTLVMCGRDDAWAPWVRHVDMAAKIAGSVLVAIEHCGHMSPMEQPDAVNAALERWLQ